MRYVLLDRITTFEPPDLARGVKCVSLADDVFADHFPGLPVMPGALMVEAMAQLAGTLLEGAARKNDHANLYAVLTEIERAKFRRPVTPGDRLEMEAKTLHVSELGGQLAVTAAVDGERAASAQLKFALTQLPPHLAQHRDAQLKVWLASAH